MKYKEFESFLTRQLEESFSSQKTDTKRVYPIESWELIQKKLGIIGARKMTSGYERSEFFDFENVLRERKQFLRLYYVEKGDSYLSFVGRRRAGSKKQAELEIPVHYEMMKRMLELIGFRVIKSIRQYQEKYQLTFGLVWIKKVQNGELYLEIQGNPKTIESIARRLGLEKSDSEERSYRKVHKEELVAV